MSALPPVGTRVRVHKNLQRGDWSVTVAGKVVANVDAITLAGVTFHYWQGGHDRIMAAHAAGKPRRRVYAWACGTVAALPQGLPATEIALSPYRSGGRFTTRAGAPVAHAEYVAFGAGAVALGAVS
jgi:hypothetical protein